jgi:hypothetical protein
MLFGVERGAVFNRGFTTATRRSIAKQVCHWRGPLSKPVPDVVPAMFLGLGNASSEHYLVELKIVTGVNR